jgi:hypothetical protein
MAMTKDMGHRVKGSTVPLTDSAPGLGAHRRVSLCETLDRVLNKGAVVAGEITISVADIDLIYLGLQMVVTSVGKLHGFAAPLPSANEAIREIH